MINQKLMVSGADYFADTYEINPYYTSKGIDVEKAKAEPHFIFRAASKMKTSIKSCKLRPA